MNTPPDIDVMAVITSLAQEFATESAGLRANLAIAHAQIDALKKALEKDDAAPAADVEAKS